MRFSWILLLFALAGGCRCGAKPQPSHPGPEPTGSPITRPTAPRPVTASGPVTQLSQDAAPPVVESPQGSGGVPPPGAAMTPAAPPPKDERADTVAVPPGFRLRDGRLDIDVHRTEVRALLQAIARATQTNLILYSDVQGVVTVQLRDQPVGSALEVVARAVGCRVTESGRMLIVRCK